MYIGHKIKIDEVTQHLQGSQGLGQRALGVYRGYIVPVVAALVKHATGVPHIYLINFVSMLYQADKYGW